MRHADPVAVHRVHVPRGVNVIVQVVEHDDLAANDEECTAAFDRIDHAYDQILVDDNSGQDGTCQLVKKTRPASPAPDARGSRECGFAFAPGACIGKYELGEKLGQGTFGMVLTARDTELDRHVALKILNPSHNDNDEILARFLQEGRAAARINHPGIITVLDSGRQRLPNGDEIAYIAMERLDGESLSKRLARAGRLGPETAAEIARQVASALQAAHRAGVLHRDLKPDNIYLVPDSAVAAGERVKVLDFGLAKFVDSSTTAMNTVFGTPRYMSPEQCRSSGQIDNRSDIYALGCILFELVTGRTPFEGELYKIIEKHMRVAPPRAQSLAREVSPALDDLINRMLAKTPGERPESMAAVEAELRLAGAENNGIAATMMPQDFKRLSTPPAPTQVADEDVTAAIGRIDPGYPGYPGYDAENPCGYDKSPCGYDDQNHWFQDSVILDDSSLRARVPGAPTTHMPTPTHVVIRPLQQRRRSVVPFLALLAALAIGVALTVMSST